MRVAIAGVVISLVFGSFGIDAQILTPTTDTPVFDATGTVAVATASGFARSPMFVLANASSPPPLCLPLTNQSAYIGFYGSSTGCTPSNPNCNTSDYVTFSANPQNGYAFTCTPYSYAWNFGDGQTSPAQQPSHQYVNSGQYTVSLVIIDGAGQNATFTGFVHIDGSGNCPTLTSQSASIGFYGSSTGCTPTNQNCNTSDSVTFDAYAQNGYTFTCSPYSYYWNFGDGQSSTNAQPSHQYASGGTYNVSLLLQDGQGHSATISGSIHIGGSSGCGSINNNSAYIGFYGSTTGCTPAHNTCSSSDSLTFSVYPQNGWAFSCEPFTFAWNFGDGQTSTSPNPIHQYTSNGTFNVTLVITDGSGKSATFQRSVIVNAQPNPNPNPNPGGCSSLTSQSAYIGFYGSSTSCTPASQTCTTGDLVTFNTYAQNGYSFNCSPYSYYWNFGDGQSSTNAQPSHQYASGGIYNVSVLLQDSQGHSATISGSIHIAGGSSSSVSITSVAPPAGPSAGSTTVFVMGSGFQPGATVSFGGLLAVTGFVSSTSLVTSTPPHASGTVDVTVMNSDGGRATLRNAFTFDRPEACTPPIIGVEPASVAILLGTSASLNVDLLGSDPLTFQWYEGLPGDTSSLLPDGWHSYVTVSPSRTTTYWVHVTNPCGAANSSAAQVTVLSERRRSVIH